jgi:hypothetical protein
MARVMTNPRIARGFLMALLLLVRNVSSLAQEAQTQQSRHRPQSSGLHFAEAPKGEKKPGKTAARTGNRSCIHGDFVSPDQKAKSPTGVALDASPVWSRCSVTLRLMTWMLGLGRVRRLFHRAEDGSVLDRSGDATSSLGDRADLGHLLRRQILIRNPGRLGYLDLASPPIFRTPTGLIGT